MEICQVCKKEGEDRRTLRLGFFYNLKEISPQFDQQSDGLYRLRTCKDCRGDFLGLLRQWIAGAHIPQEDNDPTRNIPVRVDGRTVMMTNQEYIAWHQEWFTLNKKRKKQFD